MNVLVACEYSGIVREAFKLKGHNAWSCDILDTDIPGNHIKDNVLNHLNENWDLMIAHPPCQYLSYAANKYWNRPGREMKRQKAFSFVKKLYESNIKKIAIENPVGYLNTVWIKPNQIIKPYYFGDNYQKNICLWLKNLKPLMHFKTTDLFNNQTHIKKPEPIYIEKSGKKRYNTDAVSGCKKDASKERSKFFPGVAKAMADQWTFNN